MSTVLISPEEYLARTEKPHCEYVDGVLHAKPMPTKLHALIQLLLVNLLRSKNYDALQELTVRINPAKFLIPDVVAARRLQEPYPTEPVELCIEILSPEDRLSAAFAKCEDYHAWGVPYCWVVDPQKRIAWEYHRNADPIRVDASGNLTAGTLQASMPELYAEVDRAGL